MTVVFRYDDYCTWSDTGLEASLFSEFAVRGVPLTVAVIPYACPPGCQRNEPHRGAALDLRKAAFLRSAAARGFVEVALHGYSHHAWATGGRERRASEFAGQPYSWQVSRIGEGRRYLRAVALADISTFVPPHNAYDRNTVRALEALGFRAMSADYTGGAAYPAGAVRYLPSTCRLHEVRQAVSNARRHLGADPIVVVVLHQFDFAEVDRAQGVAGLPALGRALDWLTQQPDVRLLSVREATEHRRDLSAPRLAANKGYVGPHRTASRLLPGFLALSLHVYLGTDAAKRYARDAWLTVYARTMLWYGGVAAVGCLLVLAVSRLRVARVRPHWVKYAGRAGVFGMCAVILLSLRDGSIGWAAMSAGAVFLGGGAGARLNRRARLAGEARRSAWATGGAGGGGSWT